MKREKKDSQFMEGKTGASHGLSSAEAVMVLNEFRQARAEEEKVFNDKINEAVSDIKRRALWWLTCVCAALTLFGWFADSIIRCVVSEKMVRDSVQEELGAFTRNKVESLVKVSASDLEKRIDECSNLLARAKFQLSLLRLRSSAIAGDAVAYEKLRQAEDLDAKMVLAEVDAFFAATFHLRSVDEKTEGIEMWDYVHMNLSEDELLRRIHADPGVSKDTVNCLMNLTAGGVDGKKYAGLLIKKANLSTDLKDRAVIIDCVHSYFETCPKSVRLDVLNDWWMKTKKPEYEKGLK